MKAQPSHFSLGFWTGSSLLLLAASLAQANNIIGPGPGSVFVSQERIAINALGEAKPYPALLTVAEMSGEIVSVAVTLRQIVHAVPDDLDILLVSPGGESVVLLSDAGGDSAADGATITFSDGAQGTVPDNGRLISGTYQPTNYPPKDSFPTPAPGPPYGTRLSAFNGKSPNGVWQLYVLDDQGQFGGSISGWQLNIVTMTLPPEITKQPQDQAVQVGGTARFNVEVKGTTPFAYQWFRPTGQIVVPFGQGRDTLILPEVKAADAGAYLVAVSNAAGQVISRSANLQVVGPLDVVINPPTAIVLPRSCVTFQASVSATRPLRIQWTLNGANIPNETNALLQLCPVVVSDGGHYAVVVWNDGEARRSEPGLLIVSAPTGPPPEDKFEGRPRFEDFRGTLQGNSSRAGVEPGEPVLPGGGRSVWFEWIAPASGVVQFSTGGSAFDTLLSVFMGDELAGLKPLTRDDDGGNGFTSQFKFNARVGTRYQIQVDGFGLKGAGGNFSVQWNLVPDARPVPVIVTPPETQAVRVGSPATFKVETQSATDQFQWFQNGKLLPRETQPSLFIPRATTENVGVYRVEIRNEFEQVLLSPPFQLQLGSAFLPPVWDKYPTMYFMSGNAGFIGFGLGNSLTIEVPSAASGSEGDPTPCDGAFFATLWQGLAATNSGVIQVETTGSVVPTRLAVYVLTGGEDDFSAPAFICDLDSAEDGMPAVATFPGFFGTNYAVLVEGLGDGNISLTAKMGIAPPISSPVQHCAVAAGGGIVLGVPTGASNWWPWPLIQWRFNGVDLLNETNATLLVTNFTGLMVGAYSVVLSNFVDSVTNEVAHLLMAGPFTLGYSWLGPAGSSAFKLVTSNTAPFVLETTLNLAGPWTPIATNPDPCLILSYTNFSPMLDPQRFFRAAPWSPP